MFDRPSTVGGAHLLAMWCFALELYADFAAASDIAIGLARLFGFTTPPNFRFPFLAGNIQDFWRRWHISLTSWLGDYLFTPLRMQLRAWGNAGLVLAILVNMMAVALWHSGSWNFVVFGAINGVAVAISALTLKRRNRFFKRWPRLDQARSISAPVVVFHVIATSTVFIRARTVAGGLSGLHGALDGARQLTLHPFAFASDINVFLRLSGVGRLAGGMALVGVLGMTAGNYVRRHQTLFESFLGSAWPLRWAVYYAVLLSILFLGNFDQRGFIYTAY